MFSRLIHAVEPYNRLTRSTCKKRTFSPCVHSGPRADGNRAAQAACDLPRRRRGALRRARSRPRAGAMGGGLLALALRPALFAAGAARRMHGHHRRRRRRVPDLGARRESRSGRRGDGVRLRPGPSQRSTASRRASCPISASRSPTSFARGRSSSSRATRLRPTRSPQRRCTRQTCGQLARETGYSTRHLHRRLVAATGPQSQAPRTDRSHAGPARGGAWRELGAHRDRVRLPRRVAHDQRRPRPGQRHSAGSAQPLVGAAGFEPATSRSQSERATRLRHAPIAPV